MSVKSLLSNKVAFTGSRDQNLDIVRGHYSAYMCGWHLVNESTYIQSMGQTCV